MTGVTLGLTLAAVLGCAATGGVFLAFSAFVMPALADLPAAQGIAAMTSVNRHAVRPAFMTVMFGSAALCVALVVVALRSDGGALLLVGSGLYLVGVVVLTAVVHVPANEALAGADPGGPEAPREWGGYVRRWTRWNHLRAGAALAAAAAFAGALAA
jgi:uncharacterized membrane protein